MAQFEFNTGISNWIMEWYDDYYPNLVVTINTYSRWKPETELSSVDIFFLMKKRVTVLSSNA